MTLPPAPSSAAPAFAAPVAVPDASPRAALGPPFTRPGVVTTLAVLDVLAGLVYLAGGTLVGVLALAGEFEGAAAFVAIVAVFTAALGALYLAAGAGLWALRPFGRICQLVLTVLWLLSIPLGTIVGAMTMYYLSRPGVFLLFSGRPPAAMSPAERASVERDAPGRPLMVALIVCLGFVALAIAAILAAVAIPALVPPSR